MPSVTITPKASAFAPAQLRALLGNFNGRREGGKGWIAMKMFHDVDDVDADTVDDDGDDGFEYYYDDDVVVDMIYCSS